MGEFGKLNRDLQLPSDPKMLLKNLPFNIGEEWAGKRIRKKDVFLEFGGPKVKAAAELVDISEDIHSLQDGKVEIWGPDIDEMDWGTSYSFLEIISLAGSKLNDLTPGIIERNISIYHDFIEGIMHLNMRNLIWIRLHKSLSKKGIKLEHIAQALLGQLKINFPQIEKSEIKFFVEPAQDPNQTIRILNDECYYIWNKRSLPALKIEDDEVETFYGCKGCRYYFPSHVCILTPSNYGTCGVISWTDAKVSFTRDPLNNFFEIYKGKKLDELYGSYSGINSKISEFTNNVVKKVNLFSTIKNPQTSCGTFEALIFYIPYIDGLGIADYYYKGYTPLEIKFPTVINIYNIDLQKPGYRGIAINAMVDKKFMQGDGGWKRVAWINSNLMKRIVKYIPQDLIDKIATEKQVKSGVELKEWIKKVDHPLKSQKWDGRTWINI
ncbi:MAG: CO dehydrogenase/CO-methylating acetyl-CoA synthase complex subunit beta [Candidatus Helarchaeota archaeon]